MRIAANNRYKSPELYAAQPNCIKVEEVDLETNTSTIFDPIRAAARALNIYIKYIEHYIYLKQDKPAKGKYTFKLILMLKR